MISSQLQKQTIDAMKAKDAIRVSTFRMLSAELKNAKIDKRDDLTKEEELKIVLKEAKKRRDSIEAYKKAGRDDLVESESKELKILEEFLPEQISDVDIQNAVNEAIKSTKASSMADMGKVMNTVMVETKGMADGKKVSEMVKAKLSND